MAGYGASRSGFGVELPLVFKAADTASAPALRCHVKRGVRVLMASLARSFLPPHGNHGFSGSINISRTVLFLKYFFRTAPIVISAHQGSSRDSDPSRPLGQRERFAVKCYPQTISAIVALFFARGPSTVAGLIIAIWVKAINRLTHFWQTHVGKKLLKNFPLRAYGDAPASVGFIAGRARERAPRNHAAPYSMHSDTGENVTCLHPKIMTQQTVFRQAIGGL